MNNLLTATIYLIEGSTSNSVLAYIDGYTYSSLTNSRGQYYGVPITENGERTIPDIIRDLYTAFIDGLTYEQLAEQFRVGTDFPEGKKYLVIQCHIY